MLENLIRSKARNRGGRLNAADEHAPLLHQTNPSIIAESQLASLQSVWSDAVENIPFYKSLAQREEVPRSLASWDEFFEHVPVLKKEVLINNAPLFQRKEKADKYSMTAGSTGQPFRFGQFSSEENTTAVDLLAMRAFRGMNIAIDPFFTIWGHSHLLGSGFKGWINHHVRKSKDRLLGYTRANAYYMDRRHARDYFDLLLRSRPKVICGYSNAIDLFARHNQDQKKMAHELGVKFVICTSEILPHSDSASVIQEFFNAPVFMEYGGMDFGAVAHKWHDEPYRVNWWNYLVEDLDDKDATPGSRLIVTCLYHRYLPLLRFDTGDELSDVRSRSAGGILEFDSLEGIKHDVINLDDESTIHSLGLFHSIRDESSVSHIQLVLQDGEMRILLVGAPDDTVTTRIKNRLADIHPQLARCKLEFVEDMIPNKAGKRRWIVDKRSN
ncbi:MAG: hypothetical protein AAF591_11905 [Verrucomicrobiota bacterium]